MLRHPITTACALSLLGAMPTGSPYERSSGR